MRVKSTTKLTTSCSVPIELLKSPIEDFDDVGCCSPNQQVSLSKNLLTREIPDLLGTSMQNIPESRELTMTASTTLDYCSPKYVKTGVSAQLSSTQVNKLINYINTQCIQKQSAER